MVMSRGFKLSTKMYSGWWDNLEDRESQEYN